jgi:hypothetical protein
VPPVFYYFYTFLSTAFSFVLLSVPAPVGNQRSLAEWKSNWAGVGSEIKCKLLMRSALPLIREGDGYKVEDALVLSYVFHFYGNYVKKLGKIENNSLFLTFF